MNIYTSDSTIIASAQNAVIAGEKVFTPLLCGTQCNWRQRRLYEAAFYAAQGIDGFAEKIDQYRNENFMEYCR